MNFSDDPQSPDPSRDQKTLEALEVKLDFLINLSLTNLNLVIELGSCINDSERIPERFQNELNTIYSALPNLLSLKESKPVFMDLIKKLDAKLSGILGDSVPKEETAPITKKTISKVTGSEVIKGFNRYESLIDKWGIIESIEALLGSYANLSNLAFPTFYLQGCKEIQRYSLTQETSNPNSHEIIQFPALKLKDLIFKLLREAPSARLLQNLKKMFPLQNKIELNTLEKASIQEIIRKYITNTSEFLNGQRTLQDSVRVMTSVLQQYNLGPGDLESRIPNVSFSVVKDIHKEFQLARGNDFRQLVYSETIALIHRLNDAILQNDRFIVLLRRLK
jgi:hypothetical protein